MTIVRKIEYINEDIEKTWNILISLYKEKQDYFKIKELDNYIKNNPDKGRIATDEDF